MTKERRISVRDMFWMLGKVWKVLSDEERFVARYRRKWAVEARAGMLKVKKELDKAMKSLYAELNKRRR